MSCFGSLDNFLDTLCLKGEEDEKAIIITTEPSEKKRRFFRNRSSSSSKSGHGSSRSSSSKSSHGSRRSRKGVFRRRSKSNDTVSSLISQEEKINNDEERLEHQFPASTLMERKRFLNLRALKSAETKMESYMNWRQLYQLDSTSFTKNDKLSDKEAWNFAVAHAAKYFEGKGQMPSTLPRIVRFGEKKDLRALDGRRIAQVLPGLIDKKLATLDFYALCVGVFLDVKLDRDSDETIHVLVDVRAGLNWPNPAPTVLIPFVKRLTKQLADTAPERMHKTIVYPIPSAAKPIWAIFKGLIEPKTVSKISILWGPAAANAAIPKGMTNATFSAKNIESLEDSRYSEFRYNDMSAI